MQKVIFLQQYQNYKRGEIANIGNNEAFGLLEKGVIRIFRKGQENFENEIQNRMMVSEETKSNLNKKNKYQTK